MSQPLEPETIVAGQKPLTEIEELRHLIMGREADVLANLRKRLDDPQLRAQELADVLVETIRISQENGADLAGAIEAPVQACIKQSIEKDTQFFADALFPIMGPAIRKSINEALKSFVQTINATIESKLSVQRLKWQWEAKTSGLSFGEVVLKHTLVYRVEQVLLVQRDTGLLVQHVERPDIESKDGDAVSAMLTAIQDFVSDSFAPEGEQGGDLGSVSVGDQTVWLVNSPSLTMACVIRGIAPVSLRVELQVVLEDILREFSVELSEFDGDRESLQILAPILERCFGYVETKGSQLDAEEAEFVDLDGDEPAVALKPSNKAVQALKSFVKTPFFYIAVILLSLWVWFLVVHQYERWQRADLLQALNDTPGVLITSRHWARINEWGFWGYVRPERKLVIEGFQDPTFSDADTLAKQEFAYQDERIDIQMQPYLSLDERIQLQRAKRYLQPPRSVQLHIHEGQLSATGAARLAWIDQWQGKSLGLPNMPSIDLSQLQLDLRVERKAFEQLRVSLQEHVFYFVGSKAVADGFLATGQSVVQQLQQLHALSLVLGQAYNVRLTAYSDHVGGEVLNAPVRRLRGEQVRDLLLTEGIAPNLMTVVDGGATGVEGSEDFSARRVSLLVILESPTSDLGGNDDI